MIHLHNGDNKIMKSIDLITKIFEQTKKEGSQRMGLFIAKTYYH